MVSRRKFLGTLISSAAVYGSKPGKESRADALPINPTPPDSPAVQSGSRTPATINRVALVRRHNPSASKLDPLSPLSLGNGEFAFTADITGLQTLPQSYENAMPLCTMSQWGWHTKPPTADLDGKRLRLTQYDTYGRLVGYQTSSEGQTELYNWLRENPHRLHLGQLGLRLSNGDIQTTDLSDVRQELDLWT